MKRQNLNKKTFVLGKDRNPSLQYESNICKPNYKLKEANEQLSQAAIETAYHEP